MTSLMTALFEGTYTSSVPTAQASNCFLLKLPQEILDKVVEDLLENEYRVYDDMVREDNVVMPPIWLDPKLLLISSLLSSCILRKLYKSCTFCFSHQAPGDYTLGRPDQECMKVMQNVHLQLNENEYHDFRASFYHCGIDKFTELVVANFTGTKILRNLCSITLMFDRFYELEDKIDRFLQSSFFRACGQLRGFRTVLMRLVCSRCYARYDKRYSQEERREYIEDQPLLRGIRAKLEKRLGVSVVGDLEAPAPYRCARFIKFHPRKNVPDLLEAKAKKLKAEAKRLRKKFGK